MKNNEKTFKVNVYILITMQIQCDVISADIDNIATKMTGYIGWLHGFYDGLEQCNRLLLMVRKSPLKCSTNMPSQFIILYGAFGSPTLVARRSVNDFEYLMRP